jgi:UDP-glucose 4-epimerase
MKILITGELTYTAKHTIKQMISQGHQVRYGALDPAERSRYDLVLQSPMFNPIAAAPRQSIEVSKASAIV